jgi:hypothetical protein
LAICGRIRKCHVVLVFYVRYYLYLGFCGELIYCVKMD